MVTNLLITSESGAQEMVTLKLIFEKGQLIIQLQQVTSNDLNFGASNLSPNIGGKLRIVKK